MDSNPAASAACASSTAAGPFEYLPRLAYLSPNFMRRLLRRVRVRVIRRYSAVGIRERAARHRSPAAPHSIAGGVLGFGRRDEHRVRRGPSSPWAADIAQPLEETPCW